MPANGGPIIFNSLAAGDYNVRLFNGITTMQYPNNLVTVTSGYTNMEITSGQTASSCGLSDTFYTPEGTLTIDINLRILNDMSSPKNPKISGETSILLIVEYNPQIRSILERYFSKHYTVYTASNGLEGYEKTFAIIPNLIVSDIMMPILNGLEFCKKIKTDERTSHIPVVLLTARNSSPFRIEGYEYGADDYITKPFDLALLSMKVNNLIESILREKFKKEVVLRPRDVAISKPDEIFLKKVMSSIEQNMSNSNYSVAILASGIGMSRSVLYRKIKALSGQNINNFMKSMRLKRAVQLITGSNFTINQISDMTGFSNPKYFSTCFKQKYGQTPSMYRKLRVQARLGQEE
jgi:YesN/AraC family two-component response regulator